MRTRLTYTGAIALAIALAVTTAGCPAGGVVFFKDKALESAVRVSLHQPFGYLTETALLNVRSVDARGLSIRNLDGIQFCANMNWLDLDTNVIADLTPLSNLVNLTYLNVDDNQITDLAPLAGLLRLDTLSLFKNQVADIQALVTNAKNGGLGPGDQIILDLSTLSERAIAVDIPLLMTSYGVNIVTVQAAR